MRDIVEEVLGGEGGTPPGEVRDVQVAVAGVGAVGAGRLDGVARRLRDEAFVGQVPADIDAVGVDLPGEETTVASWVPAAWHVVETLDQAERGASVALPPAESDRLRRFAGDELGEYDVLVEAVDGTDPAAVAVAANLAAAFRGGVASPVVAVPTVADGSPNRPWTASSDGAPPLLAAATGWLPDVRDRFGPDAVVPIEHGRAAELASGTASDGPLATSDADVAVERVAVDVTAALAEALGTRTRFGGLADDLHHLRGRVVAHAGRLDGRSLDAERLVGDALATPLADTPRGWRGGGTLLAHLRTPSPDDEVAQATMAAAGARLDDETDGGPPATLRGYRLTGTDRHELFLFRVERAEQVDSGFLPDVGSGGLGSDTTDVDEDPGSGFDVVR